MKLEARNLNSMPTLVSNASRNHTILHLLAFTAGMNEDGAQVSRKTSKYLCSELIVDVQCYALTFK